MLGSEAFAALLRLHEAMGVTSWLAFIRESVEKASAAAQKGRAKVKLIIDKAGTPTSMCTRCLVLNVIDAISATALINISVDRGHTHSNGTTELWASGYLFHQA